MDSTNIEMGIAAPLGHAWGGARRERDGVGVEEPLSYSTNGAGPKPARNVIAESERCTALRLRQIEAGISPKQFENGFCLYLKPWQREGAETSAKEFELRRREGFEAAAQSQREKLAGLQAQHRARREALGVKHTPAASSSLEDRWARAVFAEANQAQPDKAEPKPDSDSDEAKYKRFLESPEGKRAFAEAMNKARSARTKASDAWGMRPDEATEEPPGPDSAAEEDRADEAGLKAEAERLMLANLGKSFDIVANSELIDKIYTPLSETETYKLTGHRVPSYREHYFNPDGVEDNPDYIRLRFLGDVWVTRDGKRKRQRYWQSKGSHVRFFIPPMPIVREQLAKKTGQQWEIVEGSKKAIALCLQGIPAFALQGVSSYSQGKFHGDRLIPEIVELIGRSLLPELTVTFDADLMHKPEVQDALGAFLPKLLNAGALPFYRTMRFSPDGGAGPDDFLMTGGTKDEYLKLDRYASAATYGLFKANEVLARVITPSTLINRDSGDMLNTGEAALLCPRGRVKFGERSQRVFDCWLKDFQQMTCYSKLAYEPGFPRDMEDGLYNWWRDTGVKAIEGDVTPFLRLAQNCFPDPVMYEWGLDYLADIVQNRGAKRQTGLLLYGDPGTGKTTLSYIAMEMILGASNIYKIDQSHIRRDFNGWMARRELIVCEEIKGDDARVYYPKILEYVSSKDASVNEKFIKEYMIRNTVRFIFLSNDDAPLPLLKDDRRIAVSRVAAIWDKAEVARIRKWLEAGGAAIP